MLQTRDATDTMRSKLLIPVIVLNWLQDVLKWFERCIITRCFLRSDKSEGKIGGQHEASADQCALHEVFCKKYIQKQPKTLQGNMAKRHEAESFVVF